MEKKTQDKKNMFQKPIRTEISAIGEFGLIERLKKKVKIYHESTLKGIGDDAAVLQASDWQRVVSSDMLLEGIHFDLTYTPLKHLGYKSVAVNISDIAAMNAIPEQIIVCIGLSNRFSVEAVEELYEGICAACEDYKIDLVGGDTTSSRSGLVISITAIGKVPKNLITYRNTAKKGDILCLTGDVGAAYLGLQVLRREKQEYLSNPDMQPDLESKTYVIMRQLKPDARMDVVYELREAGVVPTSMIDVSDGLASEILHICKQSGVGAIVYEEKIPIEQPTIEAATMDFNISPITCAMNGGEDYELLFTIRQEDYEKLKNSPNISFIGYIHEAEKGIKLVTSGKQMVDIQAQGWVHF
ncbi:MAG: thiamine-phosphate kinase [Flammeovirgaceae bacterium]